MTIKKLFNTKTISDSKRINESITILNFIGGILLREVQLN
jgi:hypothetical protein